MDQTSLAPPYTALHPQLVPLSSLCSVNPKVMMPEESRKSSIEGIAQPEALLRSACTECHRRKQKCNRQWPCNNCQKRKVADQCRFRDDSKVTSGEDAWTASLEVKRKRDMHGDEEESDDDDVGDVLEAIGYSRLHMLTNLDQEVSPHCFYLAIILTRPRQGVPTLLINTISTPKTALSSSAH